MPIALQGLYLIALRFAAGTGEGNVTSLSYAYLLAATFVSATAFSLSLISAATLTRRGVDAESAAEHVVHSAWVSLALVGAAAGSWPSSAGASSPPCSATPSRATSATSSDASSSSSHRGWLRPPPSLITYPLVFVMHRTRLLIPLALAGIAVDIPISIVCRSLWGLTGVTVALDVSTLIVVLGLMAALSPRMLVLTVVGLGRLSILVGAATALAFGGASLASERSACSRRGPGALRVTAARDAPARPCSGVALRACALSGDAPLRQRVIKP